MANTSSQLNVVLKARDEASATIRKVNKSLKATQDRAKALGQQMVSTGKSFTIAGAAILAPLALIAKAAGDGEKALALLAAQTTLNTVRTAELTETAKELFRTNSNTLPEITKLLVSQTTIFGDLGDQSKQVAQDFINFAQVQDIEVSSAMQQVNSFMRAFGEEGTNTSAVVDLLTAGQNRLGVQSLKLAGLATTSAGALSALGLNAEKSLGFLGAMESAGVNVSLALTGLRSAAIKFKTPAEFRTTLIQLADMEDLNQRVAKATEVFGAFAGPGLAKLLGGGIEAIDKMSLSFEEVEGATKEAAAIIDATFNEQIAVMRNNLLLTAQEIGTAFLPVLKQIIEKITPIIDTFRVWIEDNQGLVKAFVVVVATIGILLATLGPLLIILGFAAQGFAVLIGLGPVLGTVLTFMLGPIGLLILAVIAMTVIWLIWGDKIKAVVFAVADFLARVFNELSNKINAIWNEGLNKLNEATTIIMENVKAVWETTWTTIKDFFASIWQTIKDIFFASIEPIVDKINSVLNLVKRAGSLIGRTFSKFRGGGIPFIPGLQRGGIVTSPTLATIGEAGPEAVVPLNRAGGFGMGNVTINVNGPVFSDDADRLGNELGDAILRRLNLNIRLG